MRFCDVQCPVIGAPERDVGREICQRQGIKAMLAGSIAKLGSNYVITLEAINPRSGDPFASEQVEADSKEKVLASLGTAASNLRQKLGESLSSIQKYDVKIEQATTSSLEALKAYAMGDEERTKGRSRESLVFYKRAVELDPRAAGAQRERELLALLGLVESHGEGGVERAVERRGGEGRAHRALEHRHQVRLPLISTRGRVQIGSGFDCTCSITQRANCRSTACLA